MNNKPKIVKVLFWLLVAKFVTLILFVGFFYFVKDIESETRTAMAGLKDGLIERFGLNPESESDYNFGKIVAQTFLPIVLTGLTIVCVYERKFWWSIVAIGFLLLIEIPEGFPIFTTILIIMITSSKSRGYLKKSNDTR